MSILSSKSPSATPRPSDSIRSLLSPTSIAVVGASESSAWATAFVENVRRWNFPGELHMVNPSRQQVYGQPCAPRVSAVDATVDHALVVVRADQVPAVLQDCGSAGVRSATIVASGFSEAGIEGARLADEVVSIAREHDMQVIGPNCYGFMNLARSTVLSRNFLEGEFPDDGSIGLVCQSGYMNLVSYGKMFQLGTGLRYCVSSGNELVTNANDYFDFFIDDPQIRVIGGILEQIPDPRRFEHVALRALEAKKPIVLLKLGLSEISAELTTSHTGAIAGDRTVVETFLNELGIIMVRSVDELVETCSMLVDGWPANGRTAFVSGSGGAGEYFADLVDGTAIELVPFSAQTSELIADFTGLARGAIHNPLDLTSTAEAQFTELSPMIAATDEFDVLVGLGHELRGEHIEGASATATFIGHMRSIGEIRDSGRQAFLFSGAERAATDHGRALATANGARYIRSEVGVKALDHAIRFGRSLDSRTARVRDLIARRDSLSLPLPTQRGTLSEATAKAVLTDIGARVTRDASANNVDAAVAVAREIGYPVVMKIDSPFFPHKTEVNGVVVGLRSDAEVAAAYETIFDGARRVRPDIALESVQICEQVDGAAEIIVGARVDSSIGPIILVGLGGVNVELHQDMAFLLPPFEREAASHALASLRSWPLLDGYRGAPRLNVAALENLIVRVGDAVTAWGTEIIELDLNPVFVTEHEAIVGDALIVMRSGLSEA